MRSPLLDDSLEHKQVYGRSCSTGQNLSERGQTVLSVLCPVILAALLVVHTDVVAVRDDEERGKEQRGRRVARLALNKNFQTPFIP